MFSRTNCRTVRDLLPLHVGGDLPADKAALVDEHLPTCLPCFREYREFTAMRERLGVLTEQPLPEGVLDGFADEIMARIAVGEPGPRAELPTAMERARMWPRYAAAAAVLIAVGLGLHAAGAWGAAPAAVTETLPVDAGADAGPVAAADDLGIFPTPFEDQSPRPLAVPPVYDMPGHPTELASDANGLLPRSARGNVVPSFTEGARVLVDAAGSRVVLVLPQGGGLQPEGGRELRPREP